MIVVGDIIIIVIVNAVVIHYLNERKGGKSRCLNFFIRFWGIKEGRRAFFYNFVIAIIVLLGWRIFLCWIQHYLFFTIFFICHVYDISVSLLIKTKFLLRIIIFIIVIIIIICITAMLFIIITLILTVGNTNSIMKLTKDLYQRIFQFG